MNREDTKAWTLRFERPYFAKHFDSVNNEFRLLGKKEDLWRTSVWEVEVRFNGGEPQLVAVLNSCDMDENLHLLSCFAGEKEARLNVKAWTVLGFAVSHELHRKRTTEVVGNTTYLGSYNNLPFSMIILGWCYKHKEPYVKLV